MTRVEAGRRGAGGGGSAVAAWLQQGSDWCPWRGSGNWASWIDRFAGLNGFARCRRAIGPTAGPGVATL